MNTSKHNSGCNNKCCDGGRGVLTEKSGRDFTIALLGQPNTGKSTIFNKLTGSSQHVGNWPGKTVEKKEGYFTHRGQKYFIYDLPGTYSLTANSLEEVIARDFIIEEGPDLVVVVIDAAQLKRSLYMLAEVVLLGSPVVVALNKMDRVDPSKAASLPTKIGEITGIPVIPVTAVKKKEIEPLIEAIASASVSKIEAKSKPDPVEHFGPVYSQLLAKIHETCPSGYSPEWITLKLLEDDDPILDLMHSRLGAQIWQEVEEIKSKIEKRVIKGATMRYSWIRDMLASSDNEDVGEVKLCRFDTYATHPFWGNLIALGTLVIGIISAYLVAIPLFLPGLGLFFLGDPLRRIMASRFPEWIVSLLTDGILSGFVLATIVIAFIGAVYFVLGIFENTGYLARLAYLFDPFMKRIGLHGKSIMPLLMGLVCNILGVAGSRVIDTWQQRLVTLVIAPIIPCKALLVVIIFIATIFFGSKAIPIFIMLLAVMIIYIFFTSFVLRKFIVKGERSGLIMELPPYHKPVWGDILVYSLSRVKSFYRRGFWFIVFINFICWAGIYYPGGSINSSYLASIGKLFEPVGRIMGLDWRLFVSYIIAFASKEATLPAMVAIFGAGVVSGGSNLYAMAADKSPIEVISGSFGSFLASSGISAASALAFVFAITFSLPCLSTLGMIYAETRSYRWTFSVLLYYLFVSVLMGALAYQAGLLIF